jgi:hypothetical protein
MNSYIRSLGWEKGSFDVAIGIRADEIDRISPNSMEEGAIYPLITLGVRKADVLAWDRASPVRLGLPEHEGNCRWCWKKTDRKLVTVLRDDPRVFAFPAYLEARYATIKGGDVSENGARRLFRKKRTTQDIFTLARNPNIQPFVDDFDYNDEELDRGSSCGESCEIGTDGAHDQGLQYDPADLI